MWAEINFRLLCCSALPSKDLHYVAADKGEVVLADVAKKKANEMDAEAQTSAPGERIIHNVSNNKNAPKYPIDVWWLVFTSAKWSLINSHYLHVFIYSIRKM